MTKRDEDESIPADVEDIGARVETFLRAELPPSWIAAIDTGDAAALRAARGELDETRWWQRLSRAGYVAPTWPPEYGGLGASRATAIAVSRMLTSIPRPEFLAGTDRPGPRRPRHSAVGHP